MGEQAIEEKELTEAVGVRYLVAAEYTVQDLVDKGVRLKREIEQLERELAKVKSILRQQAERHPLPEGNKTVEFNGNLGSVQVTFSDPVYEIDQSRIRDIITLFGTTFDSYFKIDIDYKDREALERMFKNNENLRSQFALLT
jgi:hypothetical protein